MTMGMMMEDHRMPISSRLRHVTKAVTFFVAEPLSSSETSRASLSIDSS